MRYTLDLLKDAERRYEGPVSTRFLVVVGSVSGLVVIVLVVAYFLFLGLLSKAHLDRSRRTWNSMEARYKELSALQDTLRLVARTAEEVEGWGRSREDWPRILLHLQREIPSSIQLVRLEARDGVESPARPRRGDPMPDPSRRAQIYLNGRILGASGEEEVTRFIHALLEPTDDQAPAFRAASLVSMQRDRRETTRIVNLFDLDIAGYPRVIQ